jgi:hypothetical protein
MMIMLAIVHAHAPSDPANTAPVALSSVPRFACMMNGALTPVAFPAGHRGRTDDDVEVGVWSVSDQ